MLYESVSMTSLPLKSFHSSSCPGISGGMAIQAILDHSLTQVSHRHFSTLPQRFRASLKAVAGAPSAAVHKAYELLPTSARQLVDSLQQPTSLRRAVTLQLESAWDHHKYKAMAAGLAFVAYAVWRSMRFTASAFVDVSNSLAVTGVASLAASAAVAIAAWLYRRHFIISPNAVYRAAIMRLNTHPGILEVMGAPVVGSNVRATVLSGGGLKFKGLRPRLRSRRVQMILPLRGTERRGLVSLEAKKKHGKLKLTLLALDVPMPVVLGGEQRIYVEGGPKVYARGGVLDELRRPFLAAVSSEEVADAEDEAEERADLKAQQEGVQGPEKSGLGSIPSTTMYNRAYIAAREWILRTSQRSNVQT